MCIWQNGSIQEGSQTDDLKNFYFWDEVGWGAVEGAWLHLSMANASFVPELDVHFYDH